MSLHPSDGMLASLSEENRRLRYQEELSLCLLLCARKSTNREREEALLLYTTILTTATTRLWKCILNLPSADCCSFVGFLSPAASSNGFHNLLKNKNKTKWWLLDKLNQKVVAFKLSWNFIRYDNWKLKSSAISVFHQGAVEMKRSTLNLPPPPKKKGVWKSENEKNNFNLETQKNQKDITIKSE